MHHLQQSVQMLNLHFSLTVNPFYHSKSKNWVITLHAPDVRDGSCRMCRLRRDVLVIPSSAEKKMPTLQILPWCHMRGTLGRKHSSNSPGQRSARCDAEGAGWGETGQPASQCSGPVYFINSGRRLVLEPGSHQPYGEDVLCVRRLLTNHCVQSWRRTVTGIISGHH